jgi:1-acyl-sn-glycerol-3-phosphate acyltransferase
LAWAAAARRAGDAGVAADATRWPSPARPARGQAAFASHVRLMRALGVMTYWIEGRERLQRDGLLVLANHPTLIDVVCLISLLPNADCVVKRAVACNLFMRGLVRRLATSPTMTAPAWSTTA